MDKRNFNLFSWVSPDVGAGRHLQIAVVHNGRRGSEHHQYGQPKSMMVGFTMEEVKEGLPYEPAFRVDEDECQILLQTLWDAGFRPAGNHGSQGHLQSMQEHIADLRAIAFKVVGVPETKEAKEHHHDQLR